MKTSMKLSKTARFLCLIFAAGLAVAQQQPAKPAPSLAKPADNDAKPAATVPPDAAVVTVGAEKITRAQFEQILAALAENGQRATTPADKRSLADRMGEIMGLAQEARKRKLDQAPGVQQMMKITSDQVLANALSNRVASELKIDDAALHAYYDAHKSDFEQAKAIHILIRFKGSRVPIKPGGKDLTEEEALAKAQDIRKQLLAGGDFATIAKAESDDAVSGADGGSLGAASGRGKFVPPFEQAVFSLPIGQVSEPVKTPFGYHIIKVEERGPKPFEQARADIEKKMKPQLVREAIDKVKKDTPVTLDDSYFGK
jgi:peptidyl-prolyl cis-trans isomerase C